MTNYLHLMPEDIVVPAEDEIGNPKRLRKYFNLFSKGQIEHIPPVLVVRKDIWTREKHINVLASMTGHPYYDKFEGGESYSIPQWMRDRVDQQFSEFEERVNGAELYLLDGNHRAIAATLTNTPIFSLELEDNLDLNRIREMGRKKLYPVLFRDEETLDMLKFSFEDYCFNRMSDVRTVRQRVEQLVSERQLPKDMLRRYQWVEEK